MSLRDFLFPFFFLILILIFFKVGFIAQVISIYMKI